MKNIIFCIIALLSLFISKCVAQETFESKVKKIGITIENISKEEKATLKTELELVNNQLERGEITKEQADEK